MIGTTVIDWEGQGEAKAMKEMYEPAASGDTGPGWFSVLGVSTSDLGCIPPCFGLVVFGQKGGLTDARDLGLRTSLPFEVSVGSSQTLSASRELRGR